MLLGLIATFTQLSGFCQSLMMPVFFAFLLACILHTCCATPTKEITAIHHFYNDTSGDSWPWKNEGPRWNFSTDSSGKYLENPCSKDGWTWQGITCSKDPVACMSDICNIIALRLDGYNLSGPLPPVLSNLLLLERIDLRFNQPDASILAELQDSNIESEVNAHYYGRLTSYLAWIILSLMLHTFCYYFAS